MAIQRRNLIPVSIGVGAVVAITAVLAAQNVSQRTGVPEQVMHEEWTVKTSEQAVSRTLALVGLLDVPGLTKSATLTTLEDDNTPFLSDQVIGRPLWRITFSGWQPTYSGSIETNSLAVNQTFNVLVDPVDAKLLRISSDWPPDEPAIPSEPTADEIADQFQRSGNEVYHAFGDNEPEVTFREALEALAAECADPRTAKQIIAQYVLWSRLDRDPQPVWAITLRGIPPYETTLSGVPVDARNHFRWIVDARSGKCLCGSSTPQPVLSSDALP